MYNGASFTEDSDEVGAMVRSPIDMEMEEYYASQLHEHRKYTNDRHLHRDPTARTAYYVKHDQQRNMEQLDMDRRQKKRSKSRSQHCPSCSCLLGTTKHCTGRIKHSDGMEALLDEYQHFLESPNNQTKSCMCCHAVQNVCHQSKSKEASNYRHPRKHAYDQRPTPGMENLETSGTNDDDCYRYLQSMKNSYKKGGRKESPALKGIHESPGADKPKATKFAQPRKEHKVSPEPRTWKQYTEKASKQNGNGKNESKGNGGEDWLKEAKYEEVHTKLWFNLDCDNLDNANVEEDRKEQAKRKLDPSNELSNATRSSAMPSAVQTSLKSKNIEALAKQKVATIGDSDCSKDEDTLKQSDNTRMCRSRQRSTIRRDSARKLDEELVTSREENQEDTCGEIIVKDDDQEVVIRKNVYGGGDLDLRATKSHILGLIDRALSNEFGNSMDQQKNTDSNRELMHQELCKEITRDLLGDCSQMEDLLSHRGQRVDCVKKLKNLWWQHMSHIQDEFKKLCHVQTFLDSYSPRPSMTAIQSHTAAVEQRPEERQQQQQEKQNLGTSP